MTKEERKNRKVRIFNGKRIKRPNRFGFGVIRTISGTASDLKATIDFDTYGTKILLLKYAKIRLA